MNKPRVFLDEKLQKEFDENGFVKFQMFSKEQVSRIHNFYYKMQEQHETVIDKKKFHATNDTDNANLINETDNFIKQVMFEEMDRHFFNYKTIAANYLIKQSSPDSELGPHQDLRFVDESKFYSLNIWVATQPTDRMNGGLRFLKGSHRLHDTIRPLPSYPWKYERIALQIPRFFTDVTTEIGECVVLNHACIHASYPNSSGQNRIAAILAIVPKEAQIFHYFLPDGNPQNKVEKYAMTLNDFINLKSGQRPANAWLEEIIEYDFSQVEVPEFMQWVEQNKVEQKLNKKNVYKSIRNKLSTIFGNIK